MELKVVLSELVEVTNWYELGLQLNLPAHVLDTAKRNNVGDETRCKTEMLKEWLRRSLDQSWGGLILALESVGYEVLATKLRGKYLNAGTCTCKVKFTCM